MARGLAKTVATEGNSLVCCTKRGFRQWGTHCPFSNRGVKNPNKQLLSCSPLLFSIPKLFLSLSLLRCKERGEQFLLPLLRVLLNIHVWRGRLCSSNSYDVEVSVQKHSLSHISQRQTLSTSLFSAFSTTSPHMIVCTAHITSLSAVTCFFLLKRGMKINKRKVCTSITIAIASQILMYQVQKQ